MPCPEVSTPRSAGVRLSWLGGLCVLLLSAALLGPVLQHDFVSWDDDLHVYANPRLHPVTWSHIGAFWQAPYEQLYIPLTYTAWALLAWLTQTVRPGPLTAGLFHGLNLLLHLANVLVVYRLGLLLVHDQPAQPIERGTVGAAAAGALVFAWHPLQVEAVAWVSGLKDVLCGWGFLLAVWHYLAYVRADRGARRFGHYAVATTAFGLGLMAKPTAVMTPVVAGLLATLGAGQSWKVTIRGLAPWLVVAAGWGVWTKTFQPDTALGNTVPLGLRPFIAADAVVFYLEKLLWPLHLGPDYGRTPHMVLGQAWAWLTSLVPIGVGLGLWFSRRRLPVGLLATGLFVAGLLPVLGLVPFLFQEHSTVADRYAYLALLGPALMVPWLLKQWRDWKIAWLVGGGTVALLGWCCVSQIHVWKDTTTLFTHALKINPGSALAHNNLGLFLAQQGRLDEAIVHYRQALQLNPDYAYTHNNLGLALTNQGRLDEAIVHYTVALRLKPHYRSARNNLALTLIRQGKPNLAITHLRKLLDRMPEDAMSHNNLGIALAAQGDYPAAIHRFAHALRLKPDYANAYQNLGLAFEHQGRTSEAEAAFRMALRLRPQWTQAALSLSKLLASGKRPSEQVTKDMYHGLP